MNFYNTIASRQILLAQIEAAEGELTPELEAALTISDDRIQEGVLDLLGLRETAQTNIMGAKAEMERLTAFLKSNENAVARVNAILLETTKRFGTVNAGTYRLSTRPSVGTLIEEGAQIPTKYCKLVPAVEAYYQPDKTAVRKALEAGEVIDGASLEKRTNLVVK